ncbi:MAG: sugar phosphate isomerase/epimerase [Candidatus Poribacteria bacterium]|nr:sugar phosphate isomerase/epimerase [Candidatus Poribacteria bacterium]
MSDFQYCLNASTIRPTPVMDKIRIAGETGYQAIELWSNELTEYEQGGGSIADVKKALDDHGLAVPTVIALFGWLGSTGDEHQKALDDAKKKLEHAAKVGAKRMIASPPRDKVDLSTGGAQYRELLKLGEAAGVLPAMEFLGFVNSVHTIPQAWKIVQDANHPDATVVMDPFHILRGGGSVEQVSLVPGSNVAIWHWNDVPGGKPVLEQSDADRVMPGDGVGPLKEMERRILDSGYKGYVSLELFNQAYWEQDPSEVARIGLDKMRTFFA